MGKIIALISSKGGTGKSTVAIALASAFTAAGKKVLLADCDEGARCLDTMLGVNSETLFDLSDILSGSCDLEKAIIKTGIEGRISLVPSPVFTEPIDMEKLSAFLVDSSADYDYVIADMRGQLPADRIALLPKNTLFLIVTNSDGVTVRNTGLLAYDLTAHNADPRLIINKFTGKKADGSLLNIDYTVDEAQTRLMGIVPLDKIIAASRGPVYFGPAAAAVCRIASRIDGNSVPLPEINKILQ